jgi:hypothetical protein
MYKTYSAGMMLTNEIEYYMQQWSYIKIRQTKKKIKKLIDDLFHVLLLRVTDCHELLKNNTKYKNV